MASKIHRKASKAFSGQEPRKAEVSYKGDCQVAVIKFHGEIGPDYRGCSISWDRYREVLVSAFSDTKNKAVVMDIECGGGSTSETQLLVREIRRQAEFYNKPVYAFVRACAISGGYWLACAADKIYAQSTSEIGSIGAMAEWVGTSRRDKKEGIQYRNFVSGSRKVQLDPHQKLNKKDVAKAHESLKVIHDEFKSWVISRRGESLQEKPAKIMNGDWWMGRRAHELGLIDGIGDMVDITPSLLGKRINFTPYELPGSLRPAQDEAVFATPPRLMAKAMKPSLI